MKAFYAAVVFSVLGLGAVMAEEKRAEYPATETEQYTLTKLADDARQLVDDEARVRKARAVHEGRLRAFVADAAKTHQITLRAGETLGWIAESKSFYVMSDGTAPAVSAP